LILLDTLSKCLHIGHSAVRLPLSRVSGSILVTLISQPHLGHGRRAIVMGWDSGMKIPPWLSISLMPTVGTILFNIAHFRAWVCQLLYHRGLVAGFEKRSGRI
jgi:hypothetical protein